MDMGSMTMGSATTTASAAMSSMTGMTGMSSMDMGGSCKISVRLFSYTKKTNN